MSSKDPEWVSLDPNWVRATLPTAQTKITPTTFGNALPSRHANKR